jgi:hypothetical protein
MRRRLLALGGAVVLAVAACSNGSHQASPPTTLPGPSTSAAPLAGGPNPDVIPPVITVAYVNAVLRALFHVYGNATRTLLITRQVSTSVKADLRSIYNDPAYKQQLAAAQLSLNGVIDNVRGDAGDPVTVVKRLVSESNTCIFFEASTNLSSVLIHPTPSAASEYYELRPKQAGNDPLHLNPTPWAMSYNVAFLSPTTIPSRCGAA